MPPHDDALPQMLRLAVHAWPAKETADLDGWLWRASGGGSKRANSVSTLNFTGGDADAAIDDVERRYRALRRLVRFQVEEIGRPPDLAQRLSARGYRIEEITINMAKRVTSAASQEEDCSFSADPSDDWLEVYLSAITPDRRVINRQIVYDVPRPRAFVLCRMGGKPISSGLCVANGPVAIIECMASVPDGRRFGGARRILRSIEAWAAARNAEYLCLQVVSENAPAIALYEQAGFTAVAATRYFSKT